MNALLTVSWLLIVSAFITCIFSLAGKVRVEVPVLLVIVLLMLMILPK